MPNKYVVQWVAFYMFSAFLSAQEKSRSQRGGKVLGGKDGQGLMIVRILQPV